MSTIILIIVIIAAIAGFFVFKNMNSESKKPESVMAQAAPKSDKPSPDSELKTIMDSLVSLNLLIRKDPDLADEIIEEIEAIIDDLSAVTPAMMDRYPGETLTYELKKIGKEHLYKTVKEYTDLSEESRKNQLETFQKTIKSLHDVSKRSREIVEKNETAEFKTMANFLSGKF